MSSSGQILLLEKTPEQEQAEIQAAAVPLVDEGFTASLFDRDAGINLGFEPKHFLKQIKAVTACRENETIVTALEYGVKEGFFSTVRRCDLKSFLAFSKWLQSKDGQAALHNAQKTNKLKKRRLGTFDVKDVAYEQIFTAQRADFANVVKKERELFGEQMDWHRREIKRLERTLEQRIDAAIAAYRPSSEYKEPDLDEVAALAWGAYEADAAAKGKQTMARNRGGSQYATDHYSKDVRRARILEFCGDDTSKQLLDAYCQKKILHFRNHSDKRSENQFRHLLGSVGREVPVEDTNAEAHADLFLRARGPSPPPQQPPFLLQAPGTSQPQNLDRPPAVRNTRRTRSQTRANQPERGVGDHDESTAESPNPVQTGANQGNPTQPQ
ncbi:TPA_asm: hypothetical protein [Guizotia abyssinica amalgavirus 1]|nr:TPA_asm: hypothetical protein [Guizotia abyssinica amalgavirus 1]